MSPVLNTLWTCSLFTESATLQERPYLQSPANVSPAAAVHCARCFQKRIPVDQVMRSLRISPASTYLILDLIFWKALVRMESNIFTVDD